MVWACRSLDYLILKWTAVGSKRTGLLNDYTSSRRQGIFHLSPYVRESKTVLDSEFHALDFRF